VRKVKKKHTLEQLHLLDKVMEYRNLNDKEVRQWQTLWKVLDHFYLEEELYWKQRVKDQ
jgi:hypothetical protein